MSQYGGNAPGRNRTMNDLFCLCVACDGGSAQSTTAALALKHTKACVAPAARAGIKVLGALLISGWASAGAAALECPETGKAAIPALISPAEERLLATGGDDMANEVNELIVRLKNQRPGIPMEEITNELMAAYCPIIARTSLGPEAMKNRVDSFGALVRNRLASETLPHEISIVAAVPLSLEAYHALEDKAKKAGKMADEYMSSILTKAAAEP